MAGDDQRAEKYILDIPFSVLLNIYQSLDADKGWERLGKLVVCFVSMSGPHSWWCQHETLDPDFPSTWVKVFTSRFLGSLIKTIQEDVR